MCWDNGRYLVLLSQYKVIPVVTWWYWPSIGHYWLVRVGTGTGFGLMPLYKVEICSGATDSQTQTPCATQFS